MPLLKEKLLTEQKEHREIDEKLATAHIRPTTEESAIVQKIMREISEKYSHEIARSGMSQQFEQEIRAIAKRMSDKQNLEYETAKRVEILAVLSVMGLGPIQPYMEDDAITEIIVQRYNNICIEKNGVIESVDAAFVSEEQLLTIINRIVQPIGRQINLHTPMVDARLPDGSRVNATIPPVTPDGATLTIRKFSDKALTGDDYLRLGSLDERMLTFLAQCVRGRISLMVSGGTDTGKTTLLNMLSSFIPEKELIVTVEDNCELQLQQSNVRRMEARAYNSEGMMPITIQSLVRNALRMRPDRIIVGEIRDGTIVDMMASMSTGHEGSMSTVHANSPYNLIQSRMPILYGMQSNVVFSEEAQAIQISEALYLVVQIEHLADGSRRITHITQIDGVENGKIVLHDIFRYDRKTDAFYATGFVPLRILEAAEKHGVYIDTALFQTTPVPEETKKEKEGESV